MKLIILTTTMLLSILAGSLSVTIVSWAITPPLAASSQIVSSSTCDSLPTQMGDTSSSWSGSTADTNQRFALSNTSSSIYSNTSWGCTTTSAAPTNFSALADLQAGK